MKKHLSLLYGEKNNAKAIQIVEVATTVLIGAMIVLEGGEKEKEMVTGIGKEIETGLIGVEIGRGPLVREPLKILQSVLHLTSYQKKRTVRLIPWFLLLRQAPANKSQIHLVELSQRKLC